MSAEHGSAARVRAVPRVERGSRGTRRGLRLAVATAAFGCLVALAGYRTATQLNVPGHPEQPCWGLQDFRDATYYPARAFLDGRNPYDEPAYMAHYPVAIRFPLYAPATLLLHAPLALLPFETAEWVAFATTPFVVLALAWVSLLVWERRPAAWKVVAVAAVVLASRPAQKNLFIGQNAATLALASAVALLQARERPWLAGAALALTTVKPTYGGPLAVLLLASGHARTVTIGLGFAAVVNLAAGLVLVRASHGLVPFMQSLVKNQANFNAVSTVNPATSLDRLDTAALLGRLLGHALHPLLEVGIGLALLGVGCLLVHRLSRARHARAAVAYSVTGVAMLVCVYHQAYDLLALTLPLSALLREATMGGASPPLRLLAVLLATPAFNFMPTQAVVSGLGITGAAWGVVASLNGVLLLAALGVAVVLVLSRTRQHPIG